MEEITQRANVREVSSIFDSKDEILIEAFRESHHSMERAFQQTIRNDKLEDNLGSLFDGLMAMVDYWSPSIYLSVLYQATKNKRVNEITRNASERTALGVKSFLVEMVGRGVIGDIDLRLAGEDIMTSFIEQLATILEGRQESQIRDEWIKAAVAIMNEARRRAPTR